MNTGVLSVDIRLAARSLSGVIPFLFLGPTATLYILGAAFRMTLLGAVMALGLPERRKLV